ncbi:MAG: CDP-alcohol phosphatidyltransferase family protein, partial [Ilumatobacteraceae bacterium]
MPDNESTHDASIFRGIATWPNLITLVRLLCLPVFVWLLLGRHDRAYAGW